MGKYKRYLEEITKSDLMSKTDKKRIDQAVKEMRSRQPKIVDIGDGKERLEFSVKMTPPDKSTEGRNHRGFIDYDPKTGKLYRVHCDCNDFAYRLWAPFVKAKIDKWELTPQQQKRQNFKHNKAWTKETNPSGVKFICKHIYSAMHAYLDDIPG
jgi:hypothetical protein